jgi:hypothetical protein
MCEKVKSDNSKNQVQRSIIVSANSSIDFNVLVVLIGEPLLLGIGNIGDVGGVDEELILSMESVNEEADEFVKERGENKGFD